MISQILAKVAPTILSEVGKYGIKKIVAESFVSKAIRETAANYTMDSLNYTLEDWCKSKSFAGILDEFKRGNALTDEKVVRSFIDSGFYHEAETERLAGDILRTFGDKLRQSFFTYEAQAAYLHEMREEMRYDGINNGLKGVNEKVEQLRNEIGALTYRHPDILFIESLNNVELYFFLTNIFIYRTRRKVLFEYVTQNAMWDILLNKYKGYFDIVEAEGSYYGQLKEGYPNIFLNLIKSNAAASNGTIEFFEVLFISKITEIYHVVAADTLPMAAKVIITNLDLMPIKIDSLLVQLIKKAESSESHNLCANIVINMAEAVLDNLTNGNSREKNWLDRFLSVKNSFVRAYAGRASVKYFTALPQNIKDLLIAYLSPDAEFEQARTEAIKFNTYNYPVFNDVMRSELINAFIGEFDELPENYRVRVDRIMEAIKYDESAYLKRDVATYILISKPIGSKFYFFLDSLLLDNVTLSQVIGSTGLEFIKAKDENKYNYILEKIKGMRDEKEKNQKLIENYFSLNERDKASVDEYIIKNSDSYAAQRFVHLIGEHLQLHADDFMDMINKFNAFSNSESQSIKIGIVLGMVFNSKNIPRKIREDIIREYAGSGNIQLKELIIRAIFENWELFSEEIHNLAFKIIKEMNYRGFYIKNNFEKIDDLFKVKLKPYLD